MRITILGCGTSGGVPLIGCDCSVCMSGLPKNNRSRSSILVESNGKKLLIDTSPDLRMQALQNGLTDLDTILFTHAHADHIHGLDDIRSFNFRKNGPIAAYASEHTLEEIQRRFAYVFKPPIPEYGWFRPCLTAHPISLGENTIEGVEIIAFEQCHGQSKTMGFRFGNIAYSTGTNGFPEASHAALQNLDVWIVDCLRHAPAPTHAHLEMTLEWIAHYKPKRAVLTHMSHDFDYEALRAQLPPNVEPAYDGLIIEASLGSKT